MRVCRGLGLESLAWSLRRLHCPVGREALVLEVGSGGNPYFRANVLLDAYQESRERHWAPLVADRPTVIGFVEDLPFRDKAFDFVIAAHVLEHSASPEKFLRELQRVGRAGYIEVPDAFLERINPYLDHRLEITMRNGRLVIRKKPGWETDPALVELYEDRAKKVIAGWTVPRHPFAFHVRFYWDGEIEYLVENPETIAAWPPVHAEADDYAKSPTRSFKARVHSVLRRLLSQNRRNRRIDLLGLLRCPACHSERMERRQGDRPAIVCTACDAAYPTVGGIPRFTPESAT